MLHRHGDIILTDEYWDCDCYEDYIHPTADDQCTLCGAMREESPQSRMEEVLKFDLPLNMTYEED